MLLHAKNTVVSHTVYMVDFKVLLFLTNERELGKLFYSNGFIECNCACKYTVRKYSREAWSTMKMLRGV